MNLRTIDLNLLPVLEAVYTERSLTRASETLRITQPAVRVRKQYCVFSNGTLGGQKLTGNATSS